MGALVFLEACHVNSDGPIDWDEIKALFAPIEQQWEMGAWNPSSTAQHARDRRVQMIQDRLAIIAIRLEPSFLPGRDVADLIEKRDAFWIELARYGEWPWLVKKDGPARYARKAS